MLPSIPPLRIRPALPEDAEAVARVNGDAWRHNYRGLFPDEVLAARGREPDADDRRRRWITNPANTTLVAEEEGLVVGFIMAGPARDPIEGHDTEILAVYVHPDRQRRRIGDRLLRAAAAALGTDRFFLWTLRDLPPTRAFYERMGGRVAVERRATVLACEVDEVAYAWDSPLPPSSSL